MTAPYYYPPPLPQFPRPLPKAPRATLSMVLGIISVAGFFLMVIPVFAAPLAWYYGSSARREVEREPGRWSGGGEAKTGMILGMIGTGLILVLLGFLLLITAGLAFVSNYDAGYGS